MSRIIQLLTALLLVAVAHVQCKPGTAHTSATRFDAMIDLAARLGLTISVASTCDVPRTTNVILPETCPRRSATGRTKFVPSRTTTAETTRDTACAPSSMVDASGECTSIRGCGATQVFCQLPSMPFSDLYMRAVMEAN